LYLELTRDLGTPVADRVQAAATAAQRQQIAALSAHDFHPKELAGQKVESVIDHAPGDHAAIGGLKVSTATGWFAARPSGTEDIYKIYAESFDGEAQLQRIVQEAQLTVNAAIAPAASHWP
jgi:phosphoglucomutase